MPFFSNRKFGDGRFERKIFIPESEMESLPDLPAIQRMEEIAYSQDFVRPSDQELSQILGSLIDKFDAYVQKALLLPDSLVGGQDSSYGQSIINSVSMPETPIRKEDLMPQIPPPSLDRRSDWSMSFRSYYFPPVVARPPSLVATVYADAFDKPMPIATVQRPPAAKKWNKRHPKNRRMNG